MKIETYKALRRRVADAGAFRIRNELGALAVLAELALFGAGCALLFRLPPFSVGYWLIQGLLLPTSMFRMFVLLHECGHNILFRKKWMNTLTGLLVSPFCLVPYIPWRNIHFQHHRWVGVIDKDPTQAHLLELHRLGATQKLLFRVFWWLWIPIPFFRFVVNVFWMYPFKERREGRGENARKGAVSVAVAAAPHIALFALLGWRGYLTYFGPALYLFYMLFEIVNLPQHSGMFPYLSDHHPHPVPLGEQDAITRTTRLSKFFAVLLTYNFNLHTEHHLFPSIPWYSLPKVTGEIRESDECVYQEAEFLRFMADLRRKDPIEIYVNSLPSCEGTFIDPLLRREPQENSGAALSGEPASHAHSA